MEIKTHVLKQETKTFIGKIKNIKETGVLDKNSAEKSLKKLANLKQTYKTAIKYPQGSFVVDADFTILGFAEGTYDENGNITWLDRGMIFNPSVSLSKTFPFTIMAGPVPVPMYFESSLSADVLGQLNLIFNEQVKNFMPNGEISGTIALSGGVGIGIKKVLYASGGLEGKLKPDWKIVYTDEDYFTLKASVNAYAKAGIACFEGKYSFDPIYDETWIEYPKSSKAKSSQSVFNVLSDVVDSAGFSELFDTSKYELKDLDYLNSESKFLVNQTESPIALMASVDEESLDDVSNQEFKTNIYKESTPKIVELNEGKKLAVWIDADSSDINKVYLYYSLYKNGSWSNPQIVYEDDTMDYEPYLRVIDDKAYLVWQNSTKTFSNYSSLELDDIADSFDVSVAFFDENTNCFNTSTIDYDNLDMNPVICGDNNNIYVAWVNNAENNWLGNNKKNSIVYSKLSENTWSDPIIAYSDLYSIDSIATDYDGEFKIAYGMDTDGDINTTDDIRVFENGNKVSGDIASSTPDYNNHVLYWYAQNNIVTDKTQNIEGILSINTYQIVNAGDETALLYTVSDGLTSTLMISYYNEDTRSWGKGTALTDGKDFIGEFSADVSADGSINILLNSMKVIGDYSDEEPYGEAALLLISANPYCDLSLDEVYYAEDSFCAGEDMQFTIQLTNNGNKIAKDVIVEIRNMDGEVLSSTVLNDIIVPGETLETSIFYSIDESVKNQDIEIVVLPNEETDCNSDNNSKKIQLSFEASYVENTCFGYNDDGKVVISADIVNRGYNSQKNLKVSLIKDSYDGKVVAHQNIDMIASLDIHTVSFEVNANQNDIYYIVLQSENDDILDNDFMTVYSTPVNEHEWDDGTVIKEATCTTTGIIQYTCKDCDETKEEVIPVDSTKHVEVKDKAASPSCTKPGKTEGSHCSLCGKIIKAQKDIAATGHNYKTIITKATTSKNGSVIEKCTICDNVLSNTVIYYPETISLSKTSFVYSGKLQKPMVIIKGADGKTIASSNYEVMYSNDCKNVGRYTVKISFKGNYTGFVSNTYTIVPKTTSISKLTAKSKGFTVKWKKQSTQTTGYQIQYSMNRNFSSAKMVTASKKSIVSKTVSKLKGKKKYYVRIRTYKSLSGEKYYSAWSKAKTIKTK